MWICKVDSNELKIVASVEKVTLLQRSSSSSDFDEQLARPAFLPSSNYFNPSLFFSFLSYPHLDICPCSLPRRRLLEISVLEEEEEGVGR